MTKCTIKDLEKNIGLNQLYDQSNSAEDMQKLVQDVIGRCGTGRAKDNIQCEKSDDFKQCIIDIKAKRKQTRKLKKASESIKERQKIPEKEIAWCKKKQGDKKWKDFDRTCALQIGKLKKNKALYEKEIGEKV